MKVLLVAMGSGFLDEDPGSSDLFGRHEAYLRSLRALAPGAEMRMLCLVRRPGAGGWARRGAFDVAWTGALGLAGLLVAPGLFKDWRPDVVTCQSPLEDGLSSLLLARRLGAKHQTQVHFQRRQIDSDYGGGLRAVLAPRVLRHTDRIRFVSAPQRADFNAAFRLDPRRSYVAPVPMVLQTLADVDPGPEAGLRAPLVMFAGRLVAQKDLRTWLRVARRVADRRPDARFVWAGDGPQRAELEAEARRLDLPLEFAGNLDLAGLAGLYRQAAVFLLTSRDDAFGRVVAEAGAFGVPVVATRCGGPEEIVVDGLTGRLHDEGDVEGLAASVSALLKDPDLRRQLGAAARDRIRERYGLEALSDRIARGWLETAGHG